MGPDWDYVKKTTLWHYEALIKKLHGVTGYPVIWRAYNQDMTQAAVFARGLFSESNIQAGEYPAAVIRTFERLQSVGISDWGSLLDQITTRVDCVNFITEKQSNFAEFIDVLNYLLRFGFPFQTASRELLEQENSQEMYHYDILKRHKIMNSFDLLEQGQTASGRHELVEATGLPLGFVTTIVHRADIARLPFVRRKTILLVCGAGYDTLAKIAAADLAQMETDMKAYFRSTQGKPWENFKSVIVLKGLITGAKALPVILEYADD